MDLELTGVSSGLFVSLFTSLVLITSKNKPHIYHANALIRQYL